MGKLLLVIAIIIAVSLVILKYQPELITGKAVKDILETPLDNTRVIDIKAEGYTFTPDVINAKVNDTLLLKISSIDMDYRFALPEFAILNEIPLGTTVNIELSPKRPGEYTFYCMQCEFQMSGKLIITE